MSEKGDDFSPILRRRKGGETLFAVPTLDDLASDPGKASLLDARTVQALSTRALAALNALNNRGLAIAAHDGRKSEGPEDRLLDVREAAQLLGVESGWLYRRSKQLPFAIRQGRLLRFSAEGIQQFIRRRRGL